jgi:hypothetical protein
MRENDRKNIRTDDNVRWWNGKATVEEIMQVALKHEENLKKKIDKSSRIVYTDSIK